MAEHAPAAPAGGFPDTGDRGSLTVADRVLEKIARHTATGVAGVAPAGATTGRLGGALGRGYPSADVELAGTRATVSLEIATLWPHPAAQVAGRVADAVRSRLHELADVEVDAVAVSVADVARPAPAPETRTVR